MNFIWDKNSAKTLLVWYGENKTLHPWTDVKDGYKVLVSEMMLQQTVLRTVLNRYADWMEVFPDFETLSRASEEEVLLQWEGLGYYSRAKNLAKTAAIVCEKYGSCLPGDYASLVALPGIGDYTANAVLSFVYGKKAAVFDANVRRLFLRLMACTDPDSKWPVRIKSLLVASIPDGSSADFNAALMQFGQKVCLSKNPLCSDCPFRQLCQSHKTGQVSAIPSTKKTEVIRLESELQICIAQGRILFSKNRKGRFSDLWRLPRRPLVPESSAGKQVYYDSRVAADSGEGFETIVHTYTKYSEKLYPVIVPYRTIVHLDDEEYAWFTAEEMKNIPVPSCYRALVSLLCSKLTS